MNKDTQPARTVDCFPHLTPFQRYQLFWAEKVNVFNRTTLLTEQEFGDRERATKQFIEKNSHN